MQVAISIIGDVICLFKPADEIQRDVKSTVLEVNHLMLAEANLMQSRRLRWISFTVF